MTAFVLAWFVALACLSLAARLAFRALHRAQHRRLFLSRLTPRRRRVDDQLMA